MESATAAPPATSATPAIRIRELCKVFKDHWTRKKKLVLDKVSVDVRPGEIFGFIGPNGAGKSTTLKIMTGLLFPTSGQVEVLGRPIAEKEIRQRIGFLPESPQFYTYLTGAETLSLVGEIFGLPRAEIRRRTDELLGLVRLHDARDLALRKYSKGMIQRIGLAQALVNSPEVVILDEPMSDLDPIGRREILDMLSALKAQGKTVFFSTHILYDVESRCDRFALLVKGRIRYVGTVADAVARWGSVENAFMDKVREADAESPPDPSAGR
ncbi:MAG: ABC transporter ATP-binding protein [Planctomycetes bacterium]|nr:ABC transporter ATP-binding protein [Planctomycetota bacterium]